MPRERVIGLSRKTPARKQTPHRGDTSITGAATSEGKQFRDELPEHQGGAIRDHCAGRLGIRAA
jgi:hypothetical protein